MHQSNFESSKLHNNIPSCQLLMWLAYPDPFLSMRTVNNLPKISIRKLKFKITLNRTIATRGVGHRRHLTTIGIYLKLTETSIVHLTYDTDYTKRSFPLKPTLYIHITHLRITQSESQNAPRNDMGTQNHHHRNTGVWASAGQDTHYSDPNAVQAEAPILNFRSYNLAKLQEIQVGQWKQSPRNVGFSSMPRNTWLEARTRSRSTRASPIASAPQIAFLASLPTAPRTTTNQIKMIAGGCHQ